MTPCVLRRPAPSGPRSFTCCRASVGTTSRRSGHSWSKRSPNRTALRGFMASAMADLGMDRDHRRGPQARGASSPTRDRARRNRWRYRPPIARAHHHCLRRIHARHRYIVTPGRSRGTRRSTGRPADALVHAHQLTQYLGCPAHVVGRPRGRPADLERASPTWWSEGRYLLLLEMLVYLSELETRAGAFARGLALRRGAARDACRSRIRPGQGAGTVGSIAGGGASRHGGGGAGRCHRRARPGGTTPRPLPCDHQSIRARIPRTVAR